MVAPSAPTPAPSAPASAPSAPLREPLLDSILSALATNIPLPKIIADLHLSVEDLHTFLSTPGIPDQLQALRALTHFAEELQQSAARTEATAFLRAFLKEGHEPEEKRRAATALLRAGCHGSSGSAASRAASRGAAKSDIADWSPPDPTLDEEDDTDLDDDEGTGRRGDRSPSPSQEKPRPDWYRPPPPPSPPPNATPEEVVNHQIDLLRKLDTPDAVEATRAIDGSLSMPVKMFGDCNLAFKSALADSGALELANTAGNPDLVITTSPATLDPAADPPLATVHVKITHPDSRTTAIRFHLFHENYHNLPNNLRWLTATIIRDDTS